MREIDIQKILKGISSLEELSGGNLHQWKYVLENANSIWSRSPYKMGDLVRLKKTPIIDKKTSWGWLGAKHFLIEGNVGKVADIQFYNGLFIFGIEFDNESWIDYEKNEHAPDTLSIYTFSENWLAPANYEQLTCESL